MRAPLFARRLESVARETSKARESRKRAGSRCTGPMPIDRALRRNRIWSLWDRSPLHVAPRGHNANNNDDACCRKTRSLPAVGTGDSHRKYPKDVFPPTDFQTATLCGDGIYVIGCLGYPEQRRKAFTPVYRLTLETWQMEAVNTTGERPGWIHKHRARYDSARNIICIEGGEVQVVAEGGEPDLIPNNEQFELDLSRFEWQKISGDRSTLEVRELSRHLLAAVVLVSSTCSQPCEHGAATLRQHDATILILHFDQAHDE